MVGYLLAGIAMGPFIPGLIGNVSIIRLLAQLGVIFLLFGVGLHFSLRDLWEVRPIAIPGALLQTLVLTLFFIVLAHLWGWSLAAGMLLGIAVSISSTVVLLRNLVDQGLLNTAPARAAIGWLILEDLVTVLVLVLLPGLSVSSSLEAVVQTTALALFKAGVFATLMLIVGTRLIPWFLLRLTYLHSRELFIVAIFVITVGTAAVASSFFNVSLALGAFLAGVVMNESKLSHQISAEVLPFRETLSVLFFLSVGVLVNPVDLFTHTREILTLVAVVILGKFFLTFLLVVLLTQSVRSALVIAAGRSQIGEFSFLLGQTGASLGFFTQEQYTLLLLCAVLSIMINPFLFRALPWMETWLGHVFSRRLVCGQQDRFSPSMMTTLQEHVVVVGYGHVGRHIVPILNFLRIPCLVVDLDLDAIAELERQGIPALYGDAANAEILRYAHIEQARAVVVTLPDETAAEMVVVVIRSIAPQAPLIVRAATQEGARRLFALGAQEPTSCATRLELSSWPSEEKQSVQNGKLSQTLDPD
jgi:CPA2 family monovalent cation:H+ antiporter-2